MLLDVVDVKYVEDFKLRIAFENGEEGLVDFKEYPKISGVFEPLKDVAYFKKVYLNKDIGTICWPNGADIAPETLFSVRGVSKRAA